MMNQFVESIKRLYKNGRIDRDKITALRDKGKITEEDLNYILDENQNVNL